MERAPPESEASLGLIHAVRYGSSRDSPVAFLIHGRAGNVNVMKVFARMFHTNWTLIAPQAPLTDEYDGGFSWWDYKEGSDTIDNSINRAEEVLFNFIQRSIQFYALQPTRIFVMGFSQGGALVSVLIQQRPEFWCGAALLAGFVVERRRRVSVPVFMAHGTEDTTIEVAKARSGKDYLTAMGADVTYVEEPTGHKVGGKGMSALKHFITGLEAQ